jgi:hypothetical protein
MTWFADLAACDCFGVEHTQTLRAIGWLKRGQPYTIGAIPAPIFLRVCQLLQNPWSPYTTGGVHFCDLCQFSGGNGTVHFHDYTFSGTAQRCLFVPGNSVTYVAPTSIAHYIDAHQYQPPESFQEAVLGCPDMRSSAYFRALLERGGRGLVQQAHA